MELTRYNMKKKIQQNNQQKIKECCIWSDVIIKAKPVDQLYMLEWLIPPKIHIDRHPSSFSDQIKTNQ